MPAQPKLVLKSRNAGLGQRNGAGQRRQQHQQHLAAAPAQPLLNRPFQIPRPEAAKEAAKEVIPLIIKEYGKPSDAGFPDEPEEKSSAQIPVEKLDEVFATHSASELTGDEIPSEEPRAGGSDFNEISTAVNVLKGNSDNPDDKETARRVLPDIQGTQIIEKIKLDPLVRKRILMIECQLPEIPEEHDAPPEKAEETKPKKKIVFHADIDTTDIDAIDFNILH